MNYMMLLLKIVFEIYFKCLIDATPLKDFFLYILCFNYNFILLVLKPLSNIIQNQRNVDRKFFADLIQIDRVLAFALIFSL